MAKPFTLEQIAQLRKNPYTYKVTNCKIFFTAEFKKAFYQKRQEGLTLKETILELGYDPRQFRLDIAFCFFQDITGFRSSVTAAD